jgi:periplasmic divalent cation tolerance protein
MAQQISIIQTTLPSTWIEAEVGAFAQLVLEAGAACVQHSSTRSTYKWEGEIESSPEWRLQIKTSQNHLENVLKSIRENHPYEVPQIIHWPAESSAEYADWVDSV